MGKDNVNSSVENIISREAVENRIEVLKKLYAEAEAEIQKAQSYLDMKVGEMNIINGGIAELNNLLEPADIPIAVNDEK